MPFSLCHLLKSNPELDVILKLVVLWVGSAVLQICASLADLVVSKACRSEHTRHLKVPVQELLTELLILGAFQ